MFNTQFYKPFIKLLILQVILVSLAACQAPLPTVQPGMAASTIQPDQPSPTSSPTTSPTETTANQPTAPIQGQAFGPTPTTTPDPGATKPIRTTLLFTGVIVPARCVQAALDEKNNPDYPYEEVASIIAKADLAVGTLNATLTDFPPTTGCKPTYVLVGRSNNADAMARAGFDLMSVATNHIKNCGLTTCGDRAFFDTLDNLSRVGIRYVGAGANHDQAIQPVVLTVNGVRFGFVSLGQIEPMAFAGVDQPGIAILNDENITKAVAAARTASDVVIAMPHWGPEDTAIPNWIQRDLAQKLVAAGADIVVGNHTHVIQSIQTIQDKPVFYGLGNFVFDQGLRDHRQGAILLLNFEGSRYLGYEIIPTHVDPDGRVHIAEPEEAKEIRDRVQQASEAIQ